MSRVLKVLLAPYKLETRIRVYVALDMQLTAQNLWPAEEDTRLCRCVQLSDRLEHSIPIGASEAGGCSETRDGVDIGVRVVNHDVRGVIYFDLGSEILRRALVNPYPYRNHQP